LRLIGGCGQTLQDVPPAVDCGVGLLASLISGEIDRLRAFIAFISCDDSAVL
jgi:hypothetical protein